MGHWCVQSVRSIFSLMPFSSHSLPLFQRAVLMGHGFFRNIHQLWHRYSTGCSGHLLHYGAPSGLTSSSILSPLFSQRWHQAAWLSCVLRKVHWNKPCLPEATPGIFSEATTAAPTLQNPHHLHSVQLASPAGLKTSFQYEGIYCNLATKTKIAVQLEVLCS